MKSPFIFCLCLISIALTAGGCATNPYKFGQNPDTPLTLKLRVAEPQVERGRPLPVVDGLGHYLFSLPSKLLLWSWQVDNHNISQETEALIKTYMADNNLDNVKIRINQYSPGDEWRRLIKNREMPGFFRYTGGVISITLYTILPGRLIGGDNYNPYTNTINIYSNSHAVAMHEAAHAKDFGSKQNRNWKGWYTFIRILPLVPLYQEAKATEDAIGYASEKQMPNDEKEAYTILYPAYMTYIAAEGTRWTSPDTLANYAIQLAAAIPGHIIGRIKASSVKENKSATID